MLSLYKNLFIKDICFY